MSGEKIKTFLKNNFIYFIIAFACIAYIAYGMTTIETTGKSIIEIIGSGIVIFFMGYTISFLFSLQGMLSGDRKKEVEDTNRLHSKCVAEIDEKINEMDEWCEEQNVKALKTMRKQILSLEGLKYDDCFDEGGIPKKIEFLRLNKPKKNEFDSDIQFKDELKKVKRFNKRQRHKEKVFNKAIKVKISLLSTDLITASCEKHSDPFNLGTDRRTYQKREARTGLLSKAIVGLIFSYFTFTFILGWAYLISSLVQIAIFLLMGSIKFVQSYYFVIEDLRLRTVKQINYIQKFKRDKGIGADTGQTSKPTNVILNKEGEEDNV